jgi:hypothetical protein
MCPGVDSASKNEYQVNPGGKGGRCVRLRTYHLHVPMSSNLGALTSWNPVGVLRPVMGQLYLLPFTLCITNLTNFNISDVDFSLVKICYLSWNFNEMSLSNIKI